jgi:hypothetical protein
MMLQRIKEEVLLIPDTIADDRTQAEAVIRELRQFVASLDEITNFLGDRRYIPPAEKTRLTELFKAFKARLKEAAKRKPRNEYEQYFFCPAVREASVNILIPYNSHPITSNWHSTLGGTRVDLTFLLSQLEKRFPDV